MAYSSEEIKAFEDKDRRITKQAMAKAVLSCPHWNLTDTDGCPDMDSVLELADKLVDWVYDKPESKEENIIVPQPTIEQQKALDQVFKETSWTKEQVYKQFHKYPNMQNVAICIQKIKDS